MLTRLTSCNINLFLYLSCFPQSLSQNKWYVHFIYYFNFRQKTYYLLKTRRAFFFFNAFQWLLQPWSLTGQSEIYFSAQIAKYHDEIISFTFALPDRCQDRVLFLRLLLNCHYFCYFTMIKI